MKTLEVARELPDVSRESARPDASAIRSPQAAWLSSKVQGRHLDRLAVVYVRQSSAKQVTENRESTEMQYRLRDRAVALGWSPSRVLVIDDDLGQSGQSILGRPGFQRLLAEVGLDHVGLILGLEMSRLARSCRDWHQLLELCAVFGTLLGDADGVYDPCDYNDRLLLGLKGTMSEAELHVLQGRLTAGQRNKARRGELFSHAPIGYVRSREGGLEREPDEQARGVVQLIFHKFSQLGSASAVLRYLKQHRILVGVRPHRGVERDGLVWRRPNRATLLGMLHHPVYAGAYVYGRRMTNPRKRIPGRRGSGRAWAPADQWDVLLRDQLPAYILWEQFQANQVRLRENSTKYGRGAALGGGSLLSGIVTCGRCGKHMSVSYADRSKARFTCDAARNQWGEPQCQALTARPLETLVARQLLLALEPASLELSLAAAERMEGERKRLERHHQQNVERAAHEAERAWRQYTQVEPEHRLVVRELERRWEAALGGQRTAEESLDQFRRSQPTRLSDAERERIGELAANVPALWQAETTAPSDRQTIVRQLVERVEVTVVDETERVDVAICWAGGYESRHEIRRTVSSYRRLAEGGHVLERVSELKRLGLRHAEVARRLNAEGFRAPRGNQFTVPMVTFLCHRSRQAGLLPTVSATQGNGQVVGNPTTGPLDFWRGASLSQRLNLPATTVNTWRRRGWVHARDCGGHWMYWADAAELERLGKLRHYPRQRLRAVPRELTTPVGRPPWSGLSPCSAPAVTISSKPEANSHARPNSLE
jgi:DNA invertase Pin-like site-specific DNA recombinase